MKAVVRKGNGRASKLVILALVTSLVVSGLPILGITGAPPIPADASRIFVVAGRLHGGPDIGQTVEMTVGEGTPAWANRTALGSPRYGVGGASVDGRVYVIAGYNTSSATNSNLTDVYDPVMNTWTRGPDLPDSFAFPAGVGFAGRVYSFGGANSTQTTNKTFVYDPAQGAWVQRASMPAARARAAAVVYQGKIWVLGGNSDVSTSLASVDIYDPTSDSWSAGPAMSEVRNSLSAAVLGGKIYVVGGHQNPGTYLNLVAAYDPSSGWVPKTAMPTTRSELVTVAAGDYLYAIAGQAGPTAVTANVERYDPTANSWSSAPPIPIGVTAPAAVVLVPGATHVASRIFSIGGISNANGTSFGQNVELNLGDATLAWASRSALPVARSSMAVASAGGKIFAVGGYVSPALYGRTDIYDTSTNAWTAGADFPTNVTGASAVAFGGRIYVFGGATGTIWSSATISSSATVYDAVADTWRSLSPMPRARSSAGAVEFAGKIWLMGGAADLSCGSVLTEVDIYDPSSNTWSTGPAMPFARATQGTAVLGGRIYAVGGQDVPCNPTFISTLLVYDPATGWSTKASMPTPRIHLAAVAAEGQLYAVGGMPNNTSSTSTVERYDPGADSWSTGPALPVAVGDHGLVVLAGNGASVGAQAFGVWRTGAPMPAGRSAHAMVSVGDDVYVLTGYNYSSTNWRYNVRSNTWAALASAPASFGAGAAAYWNGRIFLAGGFNGGPLNGLYIYDVRADSWSTGANLPAGRPELAFLTLGDRIYAFGGTRGAESSYTVYDPLNNSWSAEVAMAQHRAFGDGAVINGEAYLVGGVDADSGGQPIRAIQKFTPGNSTFTTVTSIPRYSFGSFVTSVGPKLFVFGGIDWPTTPRTDLDLLQVYDTSTGTWSFGPRFPVPRSYGQAAAAGSVVVAAGGENGGSPMVDVHLLSTDPSTEATGDADDTARLLLLDDNPADNSGSLRASVTARPAPSAESYARASANGLSITIENEYLRLTGSSGSWGGGANWRLSGLTDKVAGVTHYNPNANDIPSIFDGATADAVPYTIVASNASGQASLFFHRVTPPPERFEYNLTVTVRPGDPYLSINGTITPRGSVNGTGWYGATTFTAAIGGDFGGDYWYVPGAGPNAYTGTTQGTTVNNVTAGFMAMWDPAREVGVGLISSEVPPSVNIYDWYGSCSCPEGVNAFGAYASLFQNVTYTIPTLRMHVFQGAGPQKTRDLYYELYPNASGRYTNAWADGTSVGLENDVVALRGSPWADPSFSWTWDHLNNKDAGVNQSGGSGRINMGPIGRTDDLVAISFSALNLPDRSIVLANRTLSDGTTLNYTLTILPGKPYFTVRFVEHAANGTRVFGGNNYQGNVGTDLFDDQFFVPGSGTLSFTGSNGDRIHPTPAQSYFAMWDPGERVGIGLMSPDTYRQVRSYDASCCGQGLFLEYAQVAGDARLVEQPEEMTVMVYSGVGSGPVKQTYRDLYGAHAVLDARRHVANVTEVGRPFNYAAGTRYRLSVSGSFQDGANLGAVRVIEFNRALPGQTRILYPGVEYSFEAGSSGSRSYFMIADADPSNNSGSLYVLLSGGGAAPARITLDTAVNVINLTKTALSFRLEANELWDIAVSGSWQDGAPAVASVWLSTSGSTGGPFVELNPAPLAASPSLAISVGSVFHRGDVVVIAAVYVGAGSSIAFAVRDPSGADVLITAASVSLGIASVTFTLADDAPAGTYSVFASAPDATAVAAFDVFLPGVVVLGPITIVLPGGGGTVTPGGTVSINVTVSNGQFGNITGLLVVQLYNATRVPAVPQLRSVTVQRESALLLDISIVIPLSAVAGVFTLQVILLTDHPAAGGYVLDAQGFSFEVVP